MSDPIRLFTDWPHFDGQRVVTAPTSGIILRRDAFQQAVRLISRHELHVWVEPSWRVGRLLARRFPRCSIYSIPIESDTLNLRRVPGWRPRRDCGRV